MPLLISYDIRWEENKVQEFRDTSDRIRNELKKLNAKNLLYTVWLLETTDSVQTVLARLKSLVRKEDTILVAPTNNDYKVENGGGIGRLARFSPLPARPR